MARKLQLEQKNKMAKKSYLTPPSEDVHTVVFQETPDEETPAVKNGKEFTYIGGGEDSPERIEFMGMNIRRGIPFIVDDKNIIAKISGNPTFVAGKFSDEDLVLMDEEAKKTADKSRERNALFDRSFSRRHHGA